MNRAIHYFNIADFAIAIILPYTVTIEKLLPTFLTFRSETCNRKKRLFTFYVGSTPLKVEKTACLVEDNNNDMGNLRLYLIDCGYMIELQHNNFPYAHQLHADHGFSTIKAYIHWEDPNAANALTSLLRIVYAQAILCYDAISVHASTVIKNDIAYVFMGKSGTGKSTHSQLWLRHISNTELLNDDNPTIRINDKKVWVYGTPWSGKTPCYKKQSRPVGAIIRLEQAPKNNFMLIQETDAFVALLPGCSVITQDSWLYDNLCNTLITLSELIPIGWLKCLPDAAAAELCYHSIQKIYQK